MIFQTRCRFSKAAACRALRHDSVTAVIFPRRCCHIYSGCGVLQEIWGELVIQHGYVCDMYLKLLNDKQTILHTPKRGRGRKFVFGSRFSTKQA